jgi:hypothetical protein
MRTKLRARADRGQNFFVYIARGTIFRVRVVCISYYRRYFHYVFNSRRCAVVPYWQYCSCQVIHQCIYIMIYFNETVISLFNDSNGSLSGKLVDCCVLLFLYVNEMQNLTGFYVIISTVRFRKSINYPVETTQRRHHVGVGTIE